MPFSRTLTISITAMITALALAAPAMADDSSFDTVGDESSAVADELEAVVADTLSALGVDAELVDGLTDAALRGASERLGTLLDAGSVTDEQLDALAERAHDGTLPATVAATIEDVRVRRAAFRAAAETLLAELGVNLEDGQSARDALLDHGIDPLEFVAELLDSLPPVAPAVPSTVPPTTVPATVPPTTVPATVPPTTVPPTTVPPAPAYPTPAPAPAPAYPTPDTVPVPVYPSTGGAADAGSDSV